ncbi:MAG: glycoside hydrolase family 25 protein [Lachnospiraceae bacterium]|nr:glycoside hydrolase family 25 protein [Lachnospiraceae bacterium]
MKLPDDSNDRSEMTPTIVSTIVAVSLFVLIILLLMIIINHKKLMPRQTQTAQTPSTVSSAADDGYPDTKDLIGDSSLTPDDFDFWDMYPEATSEPEKEPEATATPEVNDPSADGKHTLVVNRDGKEEWVLISPYLPKHTYDFTKLVCQSNLMKYYEDGRQVSFVGADISKAEGYVDFNKLKKAGIDFVMLRVGARGYSSGQLVLDDYFLENIKRATDAELEIGVYFFSQAVTEAEAIEEANMVLEQIKDYTVRYPIAYDMEYVDNDTSRVEGVSRADKTTIAKAFLDTVQAAGYEPMLYGDKEWLIRQIDLSKLTGYDVWLSQQEDIPDYPYQFSMWQYDRQATIDGISGYANLNISFIDYSEK